MHRSKGKRAEDDLPKLGRTPELTTSARSSNQQRMHDLRHSVLIGLLVSVSAFGQAQDATNTVIALYAQDLVVVQDSTLGPFRSNEFLRAPYTVLYFGAGWCPDCRRFSPTLAAAYDQQPPGPKRFEVLLLTMDKTEEGMLKFMRSENMKWPALAFGKAQRAEDLRKYYSSNGIPCLSVIDQRGRLVLQSKSDQDATEVLKQLQQLVTRRP
jgi:thiol-disulfide isomerase/thioredoxin